ncbi:MAG TPA: methyltransferase [Candidatus Nanoarchaeia archaeon]|nr:methyltransferase [Candidatus Nanoarchaeia archaeon]
MYEPREDSYLLLDAVKRFAHGRVLDMGTGSGILAAAACGLPEVTSVTAADIDPDCVRAVQKNHPQIAVLQSDLFSSLAGTFDMSEIALRTPALFQHGASKRFPSMLKNTPPSLGCGVFDTIIFNPPYLPQDHELTDASIYGGTRGHELIERFLKDAGHFLAPKGVILLLFSSLTGKRQVERAISEAGFTGKQVMSQKLHFEELYVYTIITA